MTFVSVILSMPAYFERVQMKGIVTLYDINSMFLKAWTRNTGSGVALLMNAKQPLRAQLMISHCWGSDLEESKEALQGFQLAHELPSDTPVWFCLFALYQAATEPGDTGPTVREQADPETLHQVLQSVSAHYGLVVLHTMCANPYSRLWCIYEIDCGIEAKAPISAAASVSYKRSLSHQLYKLCSVRSESASCSNKEDIEQLKSHVMFRGGWDAVDRQIRGFRLSSALCMAVSSGNEACCLSLLESAADPNYCGLKGWTALHYAVQRRQLGMVKRLLLAKADANIGQCKSHDLKITEVARSDACIHLAVQDLPLLRLLVESSADAGATNHLNRTPLHSLAGFSAGKLDVRKESELKDIILFLLQHKADPTVLDVNGRTATEVARSRSKDCGEVFRQLCSGRLAALDPEKSCRPMVSPDPVTLETTWFTAHSKRAWAYKVWHGGHRHIVIVSGLFMQKECFDALARSLSKCLGATCYVLDLFAHGESSCTELTEQSLTYESLTADVIEFIESLPVATCDFFGVSMSCDLGLRIAAQRPELIRSLVLVACTTSATTDWQMKVEDDLSALRTQGWAGWKDAFLASGLVAARFHECSCIFAVLERQQSMWSRNQESCPRFLAMWSKRSIDLAACARVFQPSLLVYGAGDKLTAASAKRLNAAIPNSKLTHVPEVNSPVVLECSHELSEVSLTFLANVAATSAHQDGQELASDVGLDGMAPIATSRVLDDESEDEHGLVDMHKSRPPTLQETDLVQVVDKLLEQGYGLTEV